jgi:hypothetical protein
MERVLGRLTLAQVESQAQIIKGAFGGQNAARRG